MPKSAGTASVDRCLVEPGYPQEAVERLRIGTATARSAVSATAPAPIDLKLRDRLDVYQLPVVHPSPNDPLFQFRPHDKLNKF